MANLERGEVALMVTRVIEGQPQTIEYTLKLSMNAAAQMEDKRKMPMGQIVGMVDKLSMQAIRDIAFVLLQKHHRAEITSVEKAGDLIDEAGGPEKFFEAFRALMDINQSPEGTANPPQVEPLTGTDSTAMPDGVH